MAPSAMPSFADTPVVLPHDAKDMFFLTDGGMETTLVFHEGIDLPLFSASIMLRDDKGKDWLRNYYRTYASLAKPGMGFVLESATWRAGPDLRDKLGYSQEELIKINRDGVTLIAEIASEYPQLNVVKSGTIGPRSDGYSVQDKMTAEQAERYHATQIEILTDAGVDVVSAFTLNYVDEAIGIVRAAKRVGVPVVISFTVETNGCLPTGESMMDAIATVDAATDGGPAYYMINCAHPTHIMPYFSNLDDKDRMSRIHGVRSNASKCSHAELDQAEELDDGDPVEFGKEHVELLKIMPQINILGGCCGTDHRHVKQVCESCAPLFSQEK